jgi:hypothetical protein
MLGAISVDTAAHILYTADQHNAEVLAYYCSAHNNCVCCEGYAVNVAPR